MLATLSFFSGSYGFKYCYIRGPISSILLFSTLGVFAQGSSFDKQVSITSLPVPHEKGQLFYLQRDPDENTVVYQLNTQNDKIDQTNPIDVYWIRYAEGGTRKNLSFVQRTMAYGINSKELENGDFELQLAAYKALPLRLTYLKSQKKHVVLTKINGRPAILDRIFVRITGGTTLNPDIAYFELSGRDTTGTVRLSEQRQP